MNLKSCLWCDRSTVDPYSYLVFCHKYQHCVPDNDLVNEANICDYFVRDSNFDKVEKWEAKNDGKTKH